MAPFSLVESDGGKPGKPPAQVNIFGVCTDGNQDAKLSKYPASRQERITGPVVDPEKFVTSDKVVTPKEIPSDKQKGHPVIQAYNDKDKNIMFTQFPTKLHDVPKASTNRFAAYHPYYKEKREMTESAYKPSLLRPPPQLSPPAASFNYIVKVMKPLYDVPEASTTSFATYHPHYKEKPGMTESAHDPFLHWPSPKLLSLPDALSDSIVKFATYHPHYKDILISNPTQTFVCAASCLYFGYWLGSLGNLSTASLFARDGGAGTAEPGLVTKKGELPRTSLHIFHPDQPPSLLLGSTFSKNAPSDVCMLGKSKCATMCEWPFSSATYQIQQGTNEKGKQASTERASRKQARIKKGNTERASTGI